MVSIFQLLFNVSIFTGPNVLNISSCFAPFALHLPASYHFWFPAYTFVCCSPYHKHISPLCSSPLAINDLAVLFTFIILAAFFIFFSAPFIYTALLADL